LFLWIAVLTIAALCLVFRRQLPWLVQYPEQWTLPVATWINILMDWFVKHFKVFFHAITWLLEWPMTWVQNTLHWLPWPATIAAFTILAYVAAGWRLAVFTGLALGYMVITGYWDPSMNTLALVAISVPIAIGIGFSLAICAYRSERVNRVVQPTLDLMQTVPTFAYLIPILLLFGFGPVVGLIASAIYACPPMVRNTILGLKKVPSDIVESGMISGTTKRQLFWWVQVPSAMSNIMIGINQTTMAALSMVIIAAIIGSSADIGWEVLSTMRKAQFGQSLLAGLVIALMAMMMDRISWGFTDRQRHVGYHHLPWFTRHRFVLMALALVVFFVVLSLFVPFLRSFPQEWIFYPADQINDGLNYVTANYPHVTDAIKETVFFYFLLPLRVGFEGAISPFSWGFELTPIMALSYALVIGALSSWLWKEKGWRPAVAVLIVGGFLYFGITTIPWPVFILVVTLLAWQVGGFGVAVVASSGCFFILLTGVWPQAMLSVYLCLAAVLVCLVAGGLLGIWASENARVSNFLRPINDTLQTIPLFVFLIPFLMFFQVGEFTALLAIIAYAIVPTIRYTEHGLRNVAQETVEAARSMGCTRWQILREVKLPMAAPEIMLGLNQTIMFALVMLVIAALVGTRGLGQSVYIALSAADPGLGLVAGLGMAFVAIIADRIIQSWSSRRKEVLGIV